MKKHYLLPVLIFSVFILLKPAIIQAQSLTLNDIKTQMINDWERAKAYTIDYLNTMPADKYSFKPVDSIRSFAQQMLHLASGNIFLMSSATDQKPPAVFASNLEHSATAQTK